MIEQIEYDPFCDYLCYCSSLSSTRNSIYSIHSSYYSVSLSGSITFNDLELFLLLINYLYLSVRFSIRRYINIGDPIAALGPIDLVSGSVDLVPLRSCPSKDVSLKV